MAYACSISNSSGNVFVDFDKTYPEGRSSVTYSYTNDVAILEFPADENGKTQAEPLDMKFTQEVINVNGTFKDGLESGTRLRKMLQLAKVETDSLTLQWPTPSDIWKCVILRMNIGETGGHTDVTYEVSFRIVKE